MLTICDTILLVSQIVRKQGPLKIEPATAFCQDFCHALCLALMFSCTDALYTSHCTVYNCTVEPGHIVRLGQG